MTNNTRHWLIRIAFGAIAIALLCAGQLMHAETSPVHEFARAIARTEGFYIKGTIPNRLHNPGDIMTSSRRVVYPGQIGVYHHYAVFRNDTAGWAALYAQIQRVIDGQSIRYTQSMTMTEIAKVYAANWRYWGRTVCKILRIDPSLTFEEYFGLAPRVRYTHADLPVWLQRRGDPMPTLQPMPTLLS